MSIQLPFPHMAVPFTIRGGGTFVMVGGVVVGCVAVVGATVDVVVGVVVVVGCVVVAGVGLVSDMWLRCLCLCLGFAYV